eukprot:2276925-Pleurochrysis_carterae.AAC.2
MASAKDRRKINQEAEAERQRRERERREFKEAQAGLRARPAKAAQMDEQAGVCIRMQRACANAH